MINVYSEIETLKKVLVHKPGNELRYVTPDRLEELLFAGLIDVDEAQIEHDGFVKILKDNGVEVVYLEELAAEAYDGCTDEEKSAFIDQFLDESNVADEYREICKKFILEVDNSIELMQLLMAGITKYDVKLDDAPTFIIDGMPNLYFTRDPFASVGNGITLHNMKYKTRKRETIFAQLIFSKHQDYKDTPKYYYRDDEYTLEGGDVFPYSNEDLVIGVSERTTMDAVKLVAKRIFENEECQYKRVWAINVPKNPHLMHLDTWLTKVDYSKFLYSPNLMGELKMWEIVEENGEIVAKEFNASIEEFLEKITGEKPTMIPVAGNHKQYEVDIETNFDATNFITIAPGVVVGYHRNKETVKALEEAGVKVLTFKGNELSIGMGSARCMTMPLYRQED